MRLSHFAFLAAGVAMLGAPPAFAQNGPSPVPDSVRHPCRRVHDFDYWVGTWDARPWDKPDDPSHGQLHNTREYDGCVFVERWTSPNGNGMSIVFYDRTKDTWRMVWNDDGNTSNVFDEGAVKDGVMQFKGWVRSPQGVHMMASNTLERVSADVIHHTYAVSPDSGRTWRVIGSNRLVRARDPGHP